jgi:uncharacterized membrane protein
VNLIMAGICAFGEPKENRFLRVHGFQIIFVWLAMLLSILVFGPINGVVGMMTLDPITGEPSQLFYALAFIEGTAFMAVFVLLFVALIQAARGRYFGLPIIGRLAERFA